ncbi:hypothetical protein HMPREF1979_00886 [Actinomyces johnsonii F0542]|uniref:Uncharacterized protein n=1 Tax=Actinomyces johnsonii F0542 TaxID=1321818 RepID=U1S2X3_9ACTO|nr:hypothetical protein HMPREF1979_00886 [Actinomyces johnsonii F0542]
MTPVDEATSYCFSFQLLADDGCWKSESLSSRPLVFSGVRPFVPELAEAEGSPEAVAEAVSVALAVAEADADADADAVALGVADGEAAAVVAGAEEEGDEEENGRLPQAVRDRAVMGRRAVAIRRAGDGFEELMTRE